MAQQTIGIGTTANDGTGDALRTAFDKVNDNFTEIYTELGGTSLSNLTITGNTISSDDTNGDINFDPNGTGGVVITSPGTLTASGGGSLTGTWTDMGSVTTIDINGGTIDATPIGSGSASTGAFTTLTSTTLVTSGTLDNGRLRFSENTLSSLDSNEDIVIDPAGTGIVSVQSGITATGDVNGSQLGLNGNSLVSLNTNSDIVIDPAGTGTVDINLTASTAGTPANFSAAEYITVKVGGVTKYIPLATATW